MTRLIISGRIMQAYESVLLEIFQALGATGEVTQNSGHLSVLVSFDAGSPFFDGRSYRIVLPGSPSDHKGALNFATSVQYILAGIPVGRRVEVTAEQASRLERIKACIRSAKNGSPQQQNNSAVCQLPNTPHTGKGKGCKQKKKK